MADEDDLVEPAQVHRPAQHAHILLSIDSIQSSHRFVPEQRFVTNALALPHVVDGDAKVDGLVDQYELPSRKLIHEARTVQILVANLDIKIVYHPLAVRLGTLRPEKDFDLVFQAPPLGLPAWCPKSSDCGPSNLHKPAIDNQALAARVKPRFLGKRDHARREALRNRRLRGHGLPWLTVQSTIWRVNNPNRIAWNCANKALGRNVVSQTHLR